jgi:hypothetical protein
MLVTSLKQPHLGAQLFEFMLPFGSSRRCVVVVEKSAPHRP